MVQVKDPPPLQNQGREKEFFYVSPFTKPGTANTVCSGIVWVLASPARQPGGLQLLMDSSHLPSEVEVLGAGRLGWLGVMGQVEGKWERSKKVAGFELRSETRDL